MRFYYFPGDASKKWQKKKHGEDSIGTAHT